MTVNWTTLVLLAFAAMHSANAESRPQLSAQNRLLKVLLSNYGYTSIRPVYNMSTLTTVELMLILTDVIELNERHQTIAIGAWVKQRWTDEYMTWNPDDHDGVDYLYVHKSMIWLPDITLYKNVDVDFYKDFSVYIRSTGVATWSTPVILKCTCRIDARLFPFDTQVCDLRFTSWIYDITELNLTEYKDHHHQRFYTDVGVWELMKITIVRNEMSYEEEDNNIFPDLTYSIYLRRRPMFHVLQIILPCVLLSLLNLMVFVLPPESGEKISLGVTNLLSLVLFQQLISDSVPPTSDKAPIIGYYFSPMITLACTSIVCTVTVLNVFYRDNRRPIPRWVKYVIFNILARVVCHWALSESSHKPVKSRLDGDKVQVSRKPMSMGDPRRNCLTESSATATGGEASPSKSLNRPVMGDWDDVRCKTVDNTQRLITVARPKTLNSPAMRARRQENGEAETRQDQTGNIQRSHTWQEVALVLDRTALVLSSVITLGSMVTTIISFIVHSHRSRTT